MSKRITTETQTTEEVRATRWEFFVVDHDRDESVPIGTKRLDVVVHFADMIPQRKKKDVLGSLNPGQTNGLRGLFFDIADELLEEAAAEMGLTTENDTEDALA